MIFHLGIYETVILIRISEPICSIFKNDSVLHSSWQFDLHTIFMKLNYISIIILLGFKIGNTALSHLYFPGLCVAFEKTFNDKNKNTRQRVLFRENLVEVYHHWEKQKVNNPASFSGGNQIILQKFLIALWGRSGFLLFSSSLLHLHQVRELCAWILEHLFYVERRKKVKESSQKENTKKKKNYFKYRRIGKAKMWNSWILLQGRNWDNNIVTNRPIIFFF